MPADMINNDLAAEEDDYFQEDDAEVYDDSEEEDQEVHVKYLTWNKSFCRIWTPRFSLIVLNLLILVITAAIYWRPVNLSFIESYRPTTAISGALL